MTKWIRATCKLRVTDALFFAAHKPARPLSARGVGDIVDRRLFRAGLKRPGLSCHALRHTAGTLVYKYTRGDIRRVQVFLGHSDIGTTAIYAHFDQVKDNPAELIPIKLEG